MTLSIFPIHGQELATKSPRNTMVFMAGNNGLTRPCPFSTPKHFGGKRKAFHESCRKDVLKRTLSRRSHQGLHPMSHVFIRFYMFYILLIQIHLTFKLHILGSKDVALVKHRKAMPSSSASSTPRSWGIRQPHRAELT